MMIISRLWGIARRPPGGYHSKSKGGDEVVLKLYRGKTCLRTIYNVHKVSGEEYGALIVTNKFNREIQTKIYNFNKDYHRFIIEVD